MNHEDKVRTAMVNLLTAKVNVKQCAAALDTATALTEQKQAEVLQAFTARFGEECVSIIIDDTEWVFRGATPDLVCHAWPGIVFDASNAPTTEDMHVVELLKSMTTHQTHGKQLYRDLDNMKRQVTGAQGHLDKTCVAVYGSKSKTRWILFKGHMWEFDPKLCRVHVQKWHGIAVPAGTKVAAEPVAV